MNRVLKVGFLLITRLMVLLLIGLCIHHKDRLPTTGPAIIVANHNSHLDTLVLMSLFPLSIAHHLRPVANEHYFLQQNRWLAWFSRQVLDIIPVACETREGDRQEDSFTHRTFLQTCAEALAHNQILILYPEGTRGQPEQLSQFRSGIAHLARRHPDVPIIPIFLQGLGKALPKGESLLVPFLCGIHIGEPVYWQGQKQAFLNQLSDRIRALSTEQLLPA